MVARKEAVTQNEYMVARKEAASQTYTAGPSRGPGPASLHTRLDGLEEAHEQ